MVPVLQVEYRPNLKLPLVQQNVFHLGQGVSIRLGAIVNIAVIDYNAVVVRPGYHEGWAVSWAYTILQPPVLLFEPTNFVFETHFAISQYLVG